MMCEGESHGIVWASNKCKAFQKLLIFSDSAQCRMFLCWLSGLLLYEHWLHFTYGFPKIFIATKQYS